MPMNIREALAPAPWKIIEAISLPHKALYSLYFDIFRSRPSHLAQSARAAIRSVYFETRKDRKIPTMDLREWLALVAPQSAEVASELRLPAGLFETENVGTLAYFYVLARVCSTLKPRQIVEFGTFLGAGSTTMAINSDAHILTLDLPDDATEVDVDTLNQADQQLVRTRRHRTGSFYEFHPSRSRITELRCDSRTVDLRKHVQSADICLVDGGHSLECVRADTENSLRVLRPGGIILWDDYFWLYPEVAAYVEGFAREHAGVMRIRDTGLVAWQNPLR